MGREDDRKFKDVAVNANSIIAFFEVPSNTDMPLSDWKLLDEELDRWFMDPNVSDEEKWKVRLSGYMEMVSMILG